MVEANFVGGIDLAFFEVLVFKNYGTPFSLGIKIKIMENIDFLFAQIFIAINVLVEQQSK